MRGHHSEEDIIKDWQEVQEGAMQFSEEKKGRGVHTEGKIDFLGKEKPIILPEQYKAWSKEYS